MIRHELRSSTRGNLRLYKHFVLCLQPSTCPNVLIISDNLDFFTLFKYYREFHVKLFLQV